MRVLIGPRLIEMRKRLCNFEHDSDRHDPTSSVLLTGGERLMRLILTVVILWGGVFFQFWTLWHHI